MNINPSPVSSLNRNTTTSRHRYSIKDDLEVTVTVTQNPFDLPLDVLFQMAARVNKKRSFLFVSKVLGKHIPVDPHLSLLGGAALALLYQQRTGGDMPVAMDELMEAMREPARARGLYAQLKRSPLPMREPALFIGFAETATALGHSMYDLFSDGARFMHTTRERLRELAPVLQFEEEHSHATAHRCYSVQPDFFAGTEPIVLVDDEMTTGKTALNIIRDLHGKHPRSKYILASLLDWRSQEDRHRVSELERELGITIESFSLLEGEIAVSGGPLALGTARTADAGMRPPEVVQVDLSPFFTHEPVTSEDDGPADAAYLAFTGRFGLEARQNAVLDEQLRLAADTLAAERTGLRTLCMGTGEFMYIPMRIAALLGEGVSYQSTTRSPVYPEDRADYAVRNAFPFLSPLDPDVMNFMYNIPEGHYDDLFLLMERTASATRLGPMLQALGATGVPRIVIAYFSKGTGGLPCL